MHYDVGEKVSLRGNSNVVGIVTEVLPGGLQNHVRWQDGFTTMEWRDDLQSVPGITVRLESRNGLWVAACSEKGGVI